MSSATKGTTELIIFGSSGSSRDACTRLSSAANQTCGGTQVKDEQRESEQGFSCCKPQSCCCGAPSHVQRTRSGLDGRRGTDHARGSRPPAAPPATPACCAERAAWRAYCRRSSRRATPSHPSNGWVAYSMNSTAALQEWEEFLSPERERERERTAARRTSQFSNTNVLVGKVSRKNLVASASCWVSSAACAAVMPWVQ